MLMRSAGMGVGAMMGGAAMMCGMAMAAGFGLGALTVAGAVAARAAMRRRAEDDALPEAGRYNARMPGDDAQGMGTPAL